MNIQTELFHQFQIVHIHGNIILADTAVLRKELTPLCEAPDNVGLILDCADVEYVDSSGLGLVVAIYKALMALEKRMILVNIKKPFAELLSLTKLDLIFQIVEDSSQLEAAILSPEAEGNQ